MRIDHISFVVRDLERALRVWKALGLEVGPIEEFDSEDSREAYVQTTPARILLQQPRSDKGPLAKRLDGRRSRLHHLAIAVTDVRTTIRGLSGSGWLLAPSSIDSVERRGPAWLVATLPRLLVELIADDAVPSQSGVLQHICFGHWVLPLWPLFTGLGLKLGDMEEGPGNSTLARAMIGGIEALLCGSPKKGSPYHAPNRRWEDPFHHLKLRLPPPAGMRIVERMGACFVHRRESEGILIELDPSAR